MMASYDPLYQQIDRPQPPIPAKLVTYPDIEMSVFSDLEGILEGMPADQVHEFQKPQSMEVLGQSYGYIVYSKKVALKPGSKLTIRGHIRDLAQVFVDNVMISEPIVSSIQLLTTFGSWAIRDSEIIIPEGIECADTCQLDILVKNLGRANFGVPHTFNQKKGIWEGDILIDGQVIDDWEHRSIEPNAEMDGDLLRRSSLSKHYAFGDIPLNWKVFNGTLTIPEDSEIGDTFVDFGCDDCKQWKHGAVFVNYFNVGRYHQAGPQRTLYIPGPLLKHGDNSIMVIESYTGSNVLRFTDTPDYGPTS